MHVDVACLVQAFMESKGIPKRLRDTYKRSYVIWRRCMFVALRIMYFRGQGENLWEVTIAPVFSTSPPLRLFADAEEGTLRTLMDQLYPIVLTGPFIPDPTDSEAASTAGVERPMTDLSCFARTCV